MYEFGIRFDLANEIRLQKKPPVEGRWSQNFGQCVKL